MLFCKQECFWIKCDWPQTRLLCQVGHVFWKLAFIYFLHHNCHLFASKLIQSLVPSNLITGTGLREKRQLWKKIKNTKGSITTFPQERGQEKSKLHQKHNNLKCQVYLSRTDFFKFLILALRYHYICNEVSFNSQQKKLPFRKYQERLFPGWCWL